MNFASCDWFKASIVHIVDVSTLKEVPQWLFLNVFHIIQSDVYNINISKFQFDREFEGQGFVSRETVMCYPR